MTLDQLFLQAVNRLAKWRQVFAGWQLGTRATADPECQAVRDQREAIIIMRAEVNALTALLMKSSVFTLDQFRRQMIEECEFLHKAFEAKFPGMKATDDGITYDTKIAAVTMKGWRP